MSLRQQDWSRVPVQQRGGTETLLSALEQGLHRERTHERIYAVAARLLVEARRGDRGYLVKPLEIVRDVLVQKGERVAALRLSFEIAQAVATGHAPVKDKVTAWKVFFGQCAETPEPVLETLYLRRQQRVTPERRAFAARQVRQLLDFSAAFEAMVATNPARANEKAQQLGRIIAHRAGALHVPLPGIMQTTYAVAPLPTPHDVTAFVRRYRSDVADVK